MDKWIDIPLSRIDLKDIAREITGDNKLRPTIKEIRQLIQSLGYTIDMYIYWNNSKRRSNRYYIIRNNNI